jgi:hypothetical protein
MTKLQVMSVPRNAQIFKAVRLIDPAPDASFAHCELQHDSFAGGLNYKRFVALP